MTKCNRCGRCCREEVCLLGESLIADNDIPPCKALVKTGKVYSCGLVTSPEVFYQHASFLDAAQLAKVSSSVKQQLGIGAYCDKGGFYVLEDTKH
jgi:hypothetical protein